MSTCINHPLKTSTGRCKTCNAPLCNQCKVTTDVGIFCSDACEQKARNFQEKVADVTTVRTRKKLFTKRTFKSLIVLAVVTAATVAYFYHFQDMQSMDDFKAFWLKIWEARRLLY